MRIEDRRLDASWGMIYEDTLLDVAAAIAATDPAPPVENVSKPPAVPENCQSEQARLALRWAARLPAGIN